MSQSKHARDRDAKVVSQSKHARHRDAKIASQSKIARNGYIPKLNRYSENKSQYSFFDILIFRSYQFKNCLVVD